MCPILFRIGGIPIYGFGLMMAIGFIVGNYLLVKEFKRRNLDPNIANNITIIALVAGIIGSKILFLFENWPDFIADPIGMALSPGGLTFYGGFILATSSIYLYGKKKKIKFLLICDSIAPSLMLSYGIARIGCHLAGDGDYGFPTTVPWGTDYSRGTFPPSAAFRDFPEITSQFPGGIVPNNIPCHPTPIYEFIICALMFWLLWHIRKKTAPTGKLFMVYLVLAGIERFGIEFLRINPRIFLGLSEAQIIAVFIIVIGILGWLKFSASARSSAEK